MTEMAYFVQMVGGLTLVAVAVLILVGGGIDTVRELRRRKEGK
jgi:hypothetical protein